MSRIFVNPNTFEQTTVYSPRKNHPNLKDAIATLAGTKITDTETVSANLLVVQRALRAQTEEAAAIAAGYTKELTVASATSQAPTQAAEKKSRRSAKSE